MKKRGRCLQNKELRWRRSKQQLWSSSCVTLVWHWDAVLRPPEGFDGGLKNNWNFRQLRLDAWKYAFHSRKGISNDQTEKMREGKKWISAVSEAKFKAWDAKSNMAKFYWTFVSVFLVIQYKWCVWWTNKNFLVSMYISWIFCYIFALFFLLRLIYT